MSFFARVRFLARSLSFLTHRSVGGVSGLDQKVVDTSPILESFGNAKTLRNNNSSRFGKFLKLQFTRDKYRLAGAFLETYLLEKSRVLSQAEVICVQYWVLVYALVYLRFSNVCVRRLYASSACTYIPIRGSS